MDGLAALLQTSSLQFIAEGVETACQVDTLKMMAVRLAQGHYFSVPLSVNDFKDDYADKGKAREAALYGNS